MILIPTQRHTQRNKHVIITSKRHFDVIITCLLRCVFAEKRQKKPKKMSDVAIHSYQAKNMILEIIKNISRLFYVCDVSS